MESENLLEVSHISKKFSKDLGLSLRFGVFDMWNDLFRQRPLNHLRESEFWALDGVSFEIQRGDCLALLGHNGSGKSTLLRVIAGLLKPEIGEVRVRGDVAGVISLGAGFNPLLTGRENVYINGTLFGFSHKEIDEFYDDIVRFAELEDYMNVPIKYFSSGMVVRLGFSIASILQPDVLLIDEVMAVSDQTFIDRCIQHVRTQSERAATILVSHYVDYLRFMANKVLLLDHGKVAYFGEDLEYAIGEYKQMHR